MIPLKSILYATTKAVAENFPQDVYIEDDNTQGFDKSCFFVQILPISSSAITRISNLRTISVSIKYLQQAGESITNIYDASDRLEKIFGRTLFVDDTYLTVDDIESNIYSDEVGRILDFMIHLDFDDIKYSQYTGPLDNPDSEPTEYELMKELHLQLNELRNITIEADDPTLPIVDKAIVDISKKVEGELNEKIHVSLIDHLHFAVKRLKNKEEIVNPFLAEIESFYPKEYELAKIVANRVGKAMNIAIPEGEVGFIALHVHSALNNGKLSNTVKYSYLSGNIIKHIEERLHLTIDRKSLDYTRFITHIRFAIERIMNKAKIHNDLSDVIKIRYKESYKVAKEVALIIQDYLAVKVSEEEIAYLALHIERFRVSLSD